MSASAIITAVLSLLTPQATNDGINVTVNTTNNVGHTLEQTENPLSPHPKDIIQPRREFSKTPFIIATTGAAYITTYCYLSRLAYKLNDCACWSKWRTDFSIKNLGEYKKNVCAQDFINTIKKRYHYTKETKNFFDIIIEFCNDLELEQQSLEHYLKFTNLIKKIKLEKIFPIDAKLIQEIPSRLERLEAVNKLIYNPETTHILWDDDLLEPLSISSGQREVSADTPK